MFRHSYLLFFLLILVCTIHSQEISPLNETYQKGLDSYNNNEIDTAIVYFQKAKKISKQEGDNNILEESYYYLGELYYYASQYDSSNNNHLQLLKLHQDLKDTNKILNTLNSISIVYEESGEFEKSIDFTNQGVEIAELSRDYESIARCMVNIGLIYRSQGKTDLALQQFEEAYEILIPTENWVFMALAKQNCGIIHGRAGRHTLAIRNYQESLDLFIKGEDYQGVSEIQHNIGLIYKKNGEYKKAMSYYRLSLAYDLSKSDTNGIQIDYNSIGNLHLKMDNLDSAHYYLMESYNIASSKDYKCFTGEAGALGSLYFKKGDYQLSEEYLLQELESITNCDSRIYAPRSYFYLGEIALIKNDIALAKNYFQRGKAICLSSDYDEVLSDISNSLYKIYKDENKYDSALIYLELHQSTYDSIFNQENTRKLAWLEANHKIKITEDSLSTVQKNERLNMQMTAEKERQSYNKIITWILIMSLTLVLGFLIIRYKNRLKHQKELSDQKDAGLNAIIEAQEEERKRISKDLHDGIGQQLSGLKLAWSKLSKDIGSKDSKEKAKLEELTNILDESASEVRTISHQMMPRSLQELGLVPAIEDMLDKTFKYSEIQYSFEEHNANLRFEEKIEISLYRICQELINNCIKHSHATQVSIQLMKTKKHLMLLVEDNGKGINMSDVNSGHGLINMKSRLSSIKGEINLDSSPNSGLMAQIRIDLT